MMIIKRLGIKCCNCGSFETVENTKNYGKTVMNGYYCTHCGQAFSDGTEKKHIKYKKS